MYRSNYHPFYMNYTDPAFWEEEQLQERENRLMRSFYPQTAEKIQQKVEEACDRIDYPGSMIYDEYPDRFMVEQMCKRISGTLESMDENHSGLLDELIHVLLLQEMRKRRLNKHRSRRYFRGWQF